MKAKAKGRPSFVYPKCDDQRSGCKVGWRYYRVEADAIAAAKVAAKEGDYLAGFGYDYGYMSPGSIRFMPFDDGPYAGLFEVVTP